MPADDTANLWQSIQRLPPAPGTYRVMLPSGRTGPASWLNNRWWDRNQEVNPVAWQKLGSNPAWSSPPKGDPRSEETASRG